MNCNEECNDNNDVLKIGVLSLQGAFEEHQEIMETLGCKTIQVKKAEQLNFIDGLILPGGESTAMGLIGNGEMWVALKEFINSGKATWGTCAGLILLSESCVGGSAVIENGQSLVGGMDVLVCRNYFGSQISSFEMPTPCPPGADDIGSYPGVFIRAPAILSAGPDVHVLGKVVATPCRQAAAVLRELDRKIASGEKVVMMGVVDALDRDAENHIQMNNLTTTAEISCEGQVENSVFGEEKKETTMEEIKIRLPGAIVGTNAREVICAVRKNNILGTAFHPELTKDYRWHEYFLDMVKSKFIK